MLKKITLICNILLVFILASCAGSEATRQENDPAWQAAYETLLEEYGALFVRDWPTPEGYFAMPGYFVIHDIDGDGTPELIIFQSSADGMAIDGIAMYTFRNGNLVSIDMGNILESVWYGTIRSPSSGEPGLIIESSSVDFLAYFHVIIEDDKLIRSHSGSIEFIFIHPDGTFERRRQYFLDRTEVTEDEFRAIFDSRLMENLMQPLMIGSHW
ncbi:MAG: hypothetical protein FWG66_12940 [Spirochaetes bacterium]|nr:hypothetical protein [Spirochaetota bacterium]